ncbi:CDP-glycerol glycerophosphotransferase family protein [Vibrio sp. 10N.261.51.A3]|uniref:CDP-glycerol glycerophosphotransferase family protein n=1 Tax=Vibrio sp. 10N.261.51.A3 TaxID=3229673 RepID=UPI00355375F4
MNNVNKYAIVRVSLVLLGLVPSLLFLFAPRKKKWIVFSSEFNCHFNHSSKYLFLYFIQHYADDFNVMYVVNDKEKREELSLKYGDYFISTYTFSGFFKVLLSYTWITSSIETPVGGFFLRFRRVIVHLSHGAPLKNVGLSEKYPSLKKSIYYNIVKYNFSYFFSTSKVFDENWERCLGIGAKRVLRAGLARNDVFMSSEALKPCIEPRKKVLYAPTWRPFSSTQIFPFSDFDAKVLDAFLKENNLTIYIRLHPNFEESIETFLSELSHVELLTKDDQEDINEVLPSFDLLITDYSSIYVDYLLLDRPIIFLPYDLEHYKSEVGFSLDYDRYTPGPKPICFTDFLSELRRLLGDADYFDLERKTTNIQLNPINQNFCQQNAILIKRLIND